MRGGFDKLPCYDGRAASIRVYQLALPALQYLTALVEAGEGIGLVRTLDENRGLIECWIMSDFQEEFDAILEEVGRHWPMQQLDPEFD